MNDFFSEQRFCFRNEQQDGVREGDPEWTFGDAPTGSTFQLTSDFHNPDPRYTKDSGDRASTLISESELLRRVGSMSVAPGVPVRNVIPATTDAIRAGYTKLLREPTQHYPAPPALLLAFEREQIQENEDARHALEHGGIVYGPRHNPSDTLREYVDWPTVPMGSFFCVRDNPQSHDQVYLRIAGDYVLPICEFSQWVEGLRHVTVNLKKERKLSEIIDSKSRMQSLKVTVLSAETPEEFERILADRKAADDYVANPRNDAHHQKLREENAAFWKGVNERETVRARNRDLDLQEHLAHVASLRTESVSAPSTQTPVAAPDTQAAQPPTNIWTTAAQFLKRRFGQ